jgi:hypothetical protein
MVSRSNNNFIGLESVPTKLPTYTNGKTFYEYNQPALSTDYTSAGEQYAKFRDSTNHLYNVPRNLMSYQYFINNHVLYNPNPFLKATNNHNVESFMKGVPLESSSTPYPTYSFYSSDLTTVNPRLQNAPGSKFSFIRPKEKNAAFLNNDGSVNFTAMKNTFRPTNGVNYTDTLVYEPISDGLYASPIHNYLSMPINPFFPNKDASIAVYHNNNSEYGTYPSNEYVKVVRHVLPEINKNGFNTIEEANKAKHYIISISEHVSTKTLVNDYIVVKHNDKYYLLPSFD